MNLRLRPLASMIFVATLLQACGGDTNSTATTQTESATPAPAAASVTPAEAPAKAESNFQYEADRFADIRILRYQIPGFEELTLQQKKLLFFLSQAGMSGRDMMWDQNFKHNLRIRRTIEEIVRHYPGERSTPEFTAFMTYAKRMWFANGIHHHYSSNKFQPEFTVEYFRQLAQDSAANATWPFDEGQSLEQLLTMLEPIIFDPAVAPKKVNTAADVDKIASSAVNFYEGVTEAEVAAFYDKLTDKNDPTPVSYGLNSKLVKENGEVVEKVWKLDGMYTTAIEQVVYWLEQAVTVAENDKQRTALELLVKYYKSGDLADFDAYNVAWVADTDSAIDVTNGFIEVYNDPLGFRGSYESVVSVRDVESTKRIGAIAGYAQWFEDNSPIMPEHKKADVTGITGKAIIVVSESGDASPATPIGINLPNSAWIRAQHGSKSVSLSNITDAYNSSENGALAEFAWSEEEVARGRAWAELSGHLHTDMHEVIGHASGRINDGVAEESSTLKQYASAMEEGRADLVALYYMMDPILMEIGVMPSMDVGMAEYDSYIRGGLMTQLYRIEPGEQIEEAHMRNRQEISQWAYERGREQNVIERQQRDGKTYFVINDYQALRQIFGELLREHQRIKSEGDFAAAQNLIENYGTKVDPELHAEVLQRYTSLNVAPYSGFINPRLVPVVENTSNGVEILDVKVEYPDNFVEQMLEYAQSYSFLPTVN
ncbi:MAG: dihydrofolate reductase [Pseudomonadota bacterium]